MTHEVIALRTAAQQALEALEIGWSTTHTGKDARELGMKAIADLRAALAQQDEPAQEQVIEDAIEAAYWHFDARKKGLNEWASAPQSERDAFKAEARKLVRGYFPTRQAQDTKREMLAVADAFIRGKRAALAQQDEPVQEPVAKVELMTTGGNAGLATRIVEIDDHLRERLRPGQLLYTAPPQRKPLTEEEIDNICRQAHGGADPQEWARNFARAVERAHGIGETK